MKISILQHLVQQKAISKIYKRKKKRLYKNVNEIKNSET